MSAKEFRKRVQDAKRLTPHQRQVSQGRIRPSSQSQASAKRAEGAWLRSRRARNAGTARRFATARLPICSGNAASVVGAVSTRSRARLWPGFFNDDKNERLRQKQERQIIPIFDRKAP
jgi:hypothetical protein